jgi:beta-RFAP synthase
VIENVPAEHSGLGSGTQLGLAVARVLSLAAGVPCRDAAELARLVSRGARSALGTYGFDQGGFLVEAGKRSGQVLAPLVARVPFPEAWRVVLVLPPWRTGMHGLPESAAFDRLAREPGDLDRAGHLCRLVLLGMLPALIERDLDTFGDALYEFNRRAGEAFASVQGGPYASPETADLIADVREQGVRGVGQSSWGPAVFAVVADADRADALARRVQADYGLTPSEVFSTAAANQGACCEVPRG